MVEHLVVAWKKLVRSTPYLAMLAFSVTAGNIAAQGIAINYTGTVVDMQGRGVAGATVKVYGSDLNTLSGAGGIFTLQGSLAGIIREASLPGGFRLNYSQGQLQITNPKGHPVRVEWISAQGRLKVLVASKGGEGWKSQSIDLAALGQKSLGIHWLRVVSETGVSTYRYLSSGKGPGTLYGLYGSLKKPLAKSRTGLAKISQGAGLDGIVLEVSAGGFLNKRFAQSEPVQNGLTLKLLAGTASLVERSRDFLGPGRTFRLAFLRKESPGSRKSILNYVDMAEMVDDTMPVHVFPDSRGPDTSPYGAFGPAWSPDGSSLAYETGSENLTTPISRIFIQPLSGSRIVGPGIPATNPRWWQDANGSYLIWCTSGNQSGWADALSSTLRQQVTGKGMTGNVDTLAKGSYNGGLSPDGRYLATGYPYGVMLDRTADAKHYFHIYPGHPIAKDGFSTDSLQVCNASISADSNHPGRMLFLDFGVLDEPTYANIVEPKIYAQHRMILIGDYASEAPGRIVDFIDSPAAELALEKTWDDPEWTNQPDFAVATTRDPYGDQTNPSEPLPTQPDIYLIKLSTKETLRVLKGGDQSLPVAWIGP